LNVNFSRQSPDPLGLRRMGTRVSKRGTPLKYGYLSAIGLSSVKMIADKHRHAAYHNKH